MQMLFFEKFIEKLILLRYQIKILMQEIMKLQQFLLCSVVIENVKIKIMNKNSINLYTNRGNRILHCSLPQC